jgi:hypothetical protein
MATLARYSPGEFKLPATAFPALLFDAQNWEYLAFDATADENAYVQDIAPQGISGTLTAIITYRMASATTGAVRWQVAVEAITDGDTVDTDSTSSFDTANSAGATVPGTAGHIDQVSVTLTNADSIAAGDLFRLRINRDADGTSGTDDATGDAHILCCELRDSA